MHPRPAVRLVLALLFLALSARADFPVGRQQIGAVPMPVTGRGPWTACNGADCLTVWVDQRSGYEDVFAIRSNLAVLSERSFRLGLPHDVVPFAMAGDGTGYLLACNDYRTGAAGLAFVHIDAQNGITIRTRANDATASFSRTLLWADDAYVQLFQKADGVHALILDREGRVLRFDVLLVHAPGNAVPVPVTTADRLTLLWPDAGGVVQARSFLLRDLLDPGFTAATLGPLTGGAIEPAVASSGTNLLLTWSELSGSAREQKGFARLLETNGNAIAGSGTFALPLVPEATVWSGGVYLALATVPAASGSEIFATQIDRAGTPLFSAAFAAGGENEKLAAAVPAGGGAFVVWYDDVPFAALVRGAYTDSSGRRRDGSASDPGLLLSRGYSPQHEAALAIRNNERLIAWTEQSDRQRVLVARYDSAGRALTFAPAAVRDTTAAQRLPAIATDGHSAFLVWRETTANPQADALYGMWIAEGATSGEPELIGTAFVGGGVPAVATNGRQYVVAWQHAPTAQLFLARWSSDGHRIDSTPIAFAPPRTASPSGGFAVGDSYPALAWNGQSYYLVFAHELLTFNSGFSLPLILRELHGVQLSESLHPVGPERLISNPQSGGADARQPDVLALPDGFLVAWVQQLSLDGPLLIATRRVSNNDEVFPAHGRERTAETPPILVRAGNDLRLAFGTSFFSLDGDGVITSERELDAPIVAAAEDGAGVLLIERRIFEDSRRLFGVPLAPPRARAVRR